MPRLAKGAKWTYGWVVVSPAGSITIPPDAWRDFGFDQGDEAILIPGSRRSGGFAISTMALLADLSGQIQGAMPCILARGRFGIGQVFLPPKAGLRPGARLLAVRGSRHGLGFITQGPIYEEALKQTDRLEVFV